MTAMVQAFTQDAVSRIVGLSRRQLDYWDHTGVISPSIAPFEGRGLQPLYSFRDLIKLKVGAEMRRRHIRPSRIKRTIEKLEERGFDDPFVSVRFLVEPDGSEVLYVDPSVKAPMSARDVDQLAEPINLPLRDIRSGLEASITEHLKRPTGQIRSFRNLQGSAPVVEGTRIPVEKISALAEDGWDTDRIVAAFPDLTPEDVTAALLHAGGRQARRTA
jgi:uncharacterized protein (DUF433 family)